MNYRDLKIGMQDSITKTITETDLNEVEKNEL